MKRAGRAGKKRARLFSLNPGTNIACFQKHENQFPNRLYLHRIAGRDCCDRHSRCPAPVRPQPSQGRRRAHPLRWQPEADRPSDGHVCWRQRGLPRNPRQIGAGRFTPQASAQMGQYGPFLGLQRHLAPSALGQLSRAGHQRLVVCYQPQASAAGHPGISE